MPLQDLPKFAKPLGPGPGEVRQKKQEKPKDRCCAKYLTVAELLRLAKARFSVVWVGEVQGRREILQLSSVIPEELLVPPACSRSAVSPY